MTTETKAAPSFHYYAVLDGTSEVDSVAFANNLTPKKKFGGWRNLLDFLAPDAKDDKQLVDGDHKFLPILKLDSKAKPSKDGVAVICPGGIEGHGVHDPWKGYDGGAKRTWPRPPLSLGIKMDTFGRHTAAEESAAFVNDFILDPAVQVDSAGVATINSGKALKKDAQLFRASLLYLSSHGWLGGFMKGEGLQEWTDAAPTEAQKGYVPFHSYFMIGRADAQGKKFIGPTWIVLAQCSTVNSATWAMWARVMARSNPPVRGILGYEEASPAAGASIGIANAFFDSLRAKKDFLTSWKAANGGQHWAAIVHKDAHKDTLVSFPDTPLPASSLTDYIGYLPSIPKGQAVSDPPPAFDVKLMRVARKGKPNQAFIDITPDTLDEVQSLISGGGTYVVRVTAKSAITEASIQWIHIRPTYSMQFKPAALFASGTSPTAGVTVDMTGKKKIVATAAAPGVTTMEIWLEAQPQAKLDASGMEAHHSYLWITAATKGGVTATHEFKTLGLLYMG
jgi:hypothetical protein